MFLEDGDKEDIVNDSITSFKEIQQAMKSEARKQGLKTEEEINQLVKEMRREVLEEKYEKIMDFIIKENDKALKKLGK